MGKRARHKPRRLPEKLLQVRQAFGLSQGDMFWRLDVEAYSEVKRISDYEIGKSEPPLIVLLQYARVAGVHVEDLINDNADLPTKLPGKVKHEGVRRGR